MEQENKGIQLLKNGQKGVIKIIFSRMGIVLLLLCLNIALLFALFLRFQEFLPHVYGGSAVFLIGMVLYLLNTRMDPSAKITWLVIIMLAPVFGGLLFLYTKLEIGFKAMRYRLEGILKRSLKDAKQDEASWSALQKTDPGAAALAQYLYSVSGMPVYRDTEVTYFPSGEAKLQQLLEELEKATSYIYLEYFIIDEGIMWGKILEVLARKATEGVDVRVIYDGTCEFLLLPKGYTAKLKALGIKCQVFSPATPFLSTHYNYRDHRKILVIDGKVAFNGGINLADEYINEKKKFGHWKDTAIMLRGAAVSSFTMMFLQIWDLCERKQDFAYQIESIPYKENRGYVIPYNDHPLDEERVGQRVYLDILSRAKKYVNIMTPYMILDSETENALKYAAKRGVEVSILLPGIPDKKIPYALAKSHYKALVEAGVRIYEYTPGFVHGKVFVCDDREAVVGTINLDYRSLYHHFECATYLHSVPAICEIQADFSQCITRSRQVTPESIRREKWYYKVLGVLLRVVSPLL